ncbi:MAG: acyl-CoA thioesterase [Rhodoglobus sp.]
MPNYRYKHAVSLGETSAVGNVYFSRYFEWQGRCREAFLKAHCPNVVESLLRQECAFLTTGAHCTYGGEWGFRGFEEAWIDMSLLRFRGGRMALGFEFIDAQRPGVVVAHGEQELCCKQRQGGLWRPSPFPEELARALMPYAVGPELQSALEAAVDFHRSRSEAS